jgi:hypothetical protein
MKLLVPNKTGEETMALLMLALFFLPFLAAY